ncbi:MAG: methyltransferase [Pseudorhodoplanes sp.]|uniref:methyltransferase n=1 Tax=Pseudorhodoplanes sp. TaxID=1934341 RepID=UPI003D11D088
MANPWKTFKRQYYKPFKRRFAPWRTVRYGDIHVQYKKHLDGGGTYFGQDFIPLLKSWGMPRQERAFEWCAGPGFIGLSMMAHGLCETLCLADINPEAVEACRRTVAANRLEPRVSVYESDNLKDIPASETWDLVVSNPPHFDDGYYEAELRAHDPGWRLHREFLKDVGRFLKPDGVIVLQENNNGSTAATFRNMIDEAGLKTVFVNNEIPQLTPDHRFFYLGIMHKDASVPDWAKRAAAG